MRLRPLLAAAALAVAASASAEASTLTVRVTNVLSSEGQVYVGVCDRGFSERECVTGKFAPAKAGSMSFRFTGLAPGRYAIAAYHDVNGDGRLDTQIFGLPAEPYGFSNEVGRSAPPDFAGALFDVPASGANVSVRLDRIRVGG